MYVCHIVILTHVVFTEELSADYYRIRKMLRHEFFHLEKTEERVSKCLVIGYLPLSYKIYATRLWPYYCLLRYKLRRIVYFCFNTVLIF